MAAALPVIVVTAALSLVSLHSRGVRAADSQTQCPDQNQVVTTEVTKPGTTLTLKCVSSSATVQPQISSKKVVKVCSDQNCSQEKVLSELCPGATGSQESTGQPISLLFPQLTKDTTTFYLQCKGSNTCVFSVTVQKPPPQGPQVCAVPGTTVDLALQGQGGSVKFGCGGDMKLHPSDAKKVYKDDCKTEENLKDMALTAHDQSYFLLTPTKSPPTKTLCYLCGETPGKLLKTEDYCRVLISVSAGRRIAALSAFGLALPCVLTLLQFT